MTRRLATVVLAGFHLLQATWLLHAGMDLLFPRVRPAAAASDSCCGTCGCPEHGKTARSCCCGPKEERAQVARESAPVGSIEEARCKGVEDALSQAFTQPVVGGFATIAAPVAVFSTLVLPDFHPEFPAESDRLEKVPIDRA